MFPYKINLDSVEHEVQSIYCIGRNYLEHVKELNNEVPKTPLVFVKPKGAILLGDRLQIPDSTKDLHHECELVISIKRAGENISADKASDYIEGITVGIDFTARDIQSVEKKNGHPWTLSKCQKGFAVLGKWENYSTKDYGFSLEVNGLKKQIGNSKDMHWNFSQIVSYLSGIVPLYPGDIIFTGTPAGVGRVVSGDAISAYVDEAKKLSLMIV
ncbi:MAG: fumarylacetoacetate hydrolase family protein [Bdellovibrionales bacterium]|nr:fumarylacetoacetate hydrolase family protein [Bdellovibrionales bacterium]